MRWRLAGAGVLLLLLGALAPAAQATRGLTLGLFSDPVLTSGSAAERATYLSDVASEGATIVRVNVTWASVAPASPPPGFDAANPASPGYNWASTDTEIRALRARGIKVLLNIASAPTWAEGPERPSGAQPGTWEPNPTDLAAFATAAATRYDGSFPDPLDPGSPLPRVSDYQVWNEENLAYYLSPQWKRSGRGWAPVAPALFRTMANDFYAAVKAVNPSNYVVLGGTAPYGDPPGGERMHPVAFDRYLFCLQGAAALKPISCPAPVHADALDNHPYAIAGPLQAAYDVDDVSISDQYKLKRVLDAAERSGHIVPAGSKELWATEYSWDSNPPDPQGVPIQRQARWLEQALYVFWAEGVGTVMWYQLVDSPPVPSYAATYQAGLYYLNGDPKPAAIAYRFSFVTSRTGSDRIIAWGRTTIGGTVAIEQRIGERWQVLRKVVVGADGVYNVPVAVRGRAQLRAQEGGQTSLVWTAGG